MRKEFILFIIILLTLVFLSMGMQFVTSKNYGSMVFCNESFGGTGTITLTTEGTWYGFINASADELSGVTFTDDDVNGDYLTVSSAGDYKIDLNGSVSADAASFHCTAFVNDTPTEAELEITIADRTYIYSISGAPQIVQLDAWDNVRIKCKAVGNNKTITVYHMGLSIKRMDEDTTTRQTGTFCYGGC